LSRRALEPVYRDKGVSWWVGSVLRRMNNGPALQLTGIPQTSKYTYTTGDGTTITLNMGWDIDKWKTVAKQAKKSPNREEKRKWLRALHKVLVKELKAVVADARRRWCLQVEVPGAAREDPRSPLGERDRDQPLVRG
jgi:hypothetical protein